MTRTEIARLSDADLAGFIASMKGLTSHPLKERAIDELNKRKTA
jgi:hypothetical protein